MSADEFREIRQTEFLARTLFGCEGPNTVALALPGASPLEQPRARSAEGWNRHAAASRRGVVRRELWLCG